MNGTYTICKKKRSKLLGNSGKIFFLENPTYIQGEQETFIMYCNPWRPNVSPLQSWGCGGGGRGGTMILSHLVNKIWDMRLLSKKPSTQSSPSPLFSPLRLPLPSPPSSLRYFGSGIINLLPQVRQQKPENFFKIFIHVCILYSRVHLIYPPFRAEKDTGAKSKPPPPPSASVPFPLGPRGYEYPAWT